jgi:hypothetical protein
MNPIMFTLRAGSRFDGWYRILLNGEVTEGLLLVAPFVPLVGCVI